MKLANLVKSTKANTTNNIVLAQTVINNAFYICGKRIASVPVTLMILIREFLEQPLTNLWKNGITINVIS